MKYPIGIQDFASIINDGYVYIDKTGLIHRLVTTGKVYFLSRPRRFGKSLLMSTLKYYFLGEKKLFRGLEIERLEKEWNKHPVFHIDFNGENFTNPGTLEEKIEGAVATWEQQYGTDPVRTTFGDRFAYVLEAAHRQTGRRAVVLIDEYDKPLLDVLDSNRSMTQGSDKVSLEDNNREVLKGLYSVFKAADQNLQFVLLTGVTKFSQVSVFSGFNQPDDISMSADYETLCGITEDELYAVFKESIKELAGKYRCTVEEMKQKLKKQYDGYHFSENMTDIYNPFSLLNAFKSKRIDNYWFRSGTPTYLMRLLAHTDENLAEITGRYYSTDRFIDYKADVESPLPMIYQSGYLTIKDYKMARGTYLLDFPNDEVKRGFVSAAAASYFKTASNVDSWLQDVLDAMDEADTEQLRLLFTSFLASISYAMRRKENERERERYFHYTIYLILRMISTYNTLTEKQNSNGRADFIVETPNDIYVFEFKLDGTAGEALRQIEDCGYATPYLADKRTVHKIGVSFSSETGTIKEWKTE